MTFKEQIAHDNRTIYLNPDEFGEPHEFNGHENILCIIDNNEMIDRERRYEFRKSQYADGVYLKELLIYVKGEDLDYKLPAIGRSATFDGKSYVVADAIDESGIFSITLEANKV